MNLEEIHVDILNTVTILLVDHERMEVDKHVLTCFKRQELWFKDV